MKEGSYSIDIVPLSGYLDFFGPAKEHASSENSQILKGNVIMKLSKTIKVKTITVKFKGYSQVQQYMKSTDTQPQHSISIPLLPKLKTKVLSKSIILPVGDHVFPWELEIPNIYPRTFSTSKKGTIQYQVELKVSLGINKKAMIAEHPIIIRRHLITSQEQTANIRTNTYENASSKFRYEIEAPTTISAAQPYVPISIKYNRPCMFIYTQLIQTEIYRCRNISKAEADMAVLASKKNSTMIGGQIYESFKNGDAGLSKFFKRIQPVTLNTIDPEADVLPLLLLHTLRDTSLLTPGIESPLISIYHQLEVTFNFGGGQQHDEIRAKIPILVSSVPDSVIKQKSRDSLLPNTPTTIEKYLMEKQLHRVPHSVEVIDTNNSLDKKLSDRNTLDEPAIMSMRNNVLTLDEDKSIKKSVSDQNMQQTITKVMEDEKRRSITPPPSFTKPNMINTQLANTFESSVSLTSPYTPNRPTLVSSKTSQSADLVLQPPMESFSGLLPPPRRARKKESPSSVSSVEEYSSSRVANNNISSASNKRSALPLPPLPTSSNSSIGSNNSRPTSPMSISLSTTGGGNGNYQAFKHTSSEYISTPPQSPLPPSTPRSLLRLNQSRSSCTTSSIDSQLSRKRSNSTNNENFAVDDYSRTITSHYCSADLPPIPPAITRQKLPSLPNVDKDENRKTRMYYEDESDDEEDDEEDYTFFLQQTFK